MANMDFCDKHNMVAFLQKPTGSEEFHQIVDFLAGSHIMLALTANPTIYVSLIEQFWQTATVKIVNDGEQQIIVTVNGQTIAITEASVRRHLQLADSNGISSLPNTEIFEQLTLMRYVSNGDKLTFQKEGQTFRSKLKSTSVRRKARMVISGDEEDLVSEDPSKQGRMTETEYEDVDVETEYEEVEYEVDQTDTLQQITPTKVSQDASRERVKTYESYTRRRSTVSSRDNTVGRLFSTAEEILSADERIAQKLNEEEMANATSREEHERIDFEKALELQKQLDEREETDNID
ncbi:hypothetical protein Tco_0377079 [Tanacetum coccineum]